jgi:hypothetical protein
VVLSQHRAGAMASEGRSKRIFFFQFKEGIVEEIRKVKNEVKLLREIVRG